MTEHTEQSFREQPVSRRALLAAGLGAGTIWVTGCNNETNPDIPDCGDSLSVVERAETDTNPLDLTTGYNWRIPGVSRSPGGLWLSPQPAETVPMNLYGARLDVEGDFAVGARVAFNRHSEFTLQLQDGVALSFDGFVQSPAGMRITVGQQNGSIEVWRNEHDPPTTRQFTAGGERQKQVVVERQGGQLAVHVGDQRIVTVEDIFASNRVWFGLAANGAPCDLRDLSARELPGGTVQVVDTSTLEFPQCADGLAARVAEKTAGRAEPLKVGTAMRLAPFVESDRYGSLLIGEFDSLTTENAGKFPRLQPHEGRFEFDELNAIMDIASRHNKDLWLHTLVWHNELPDWVKLKTPDQLKAVMTEHITQVMAHTRGKVKGVDVVNEPLAEYNGNLRDTPWLRGMGPDYIAIALEAAQRADPDAELWINEYGWDKDNQKDEDRFQTLFAIAKNLKARGVRLDGIGLQGHVLVSPRDNANLDVLRRRVDAFAEIGAKVRISEIDVTEKAGRKEQARHMADMLRFAISHPNVTGYTIWGIGGPYVATANVRKPSIEVRTPWDEHLEPTIIYQELQKAAA